MAPSSGIVEVGPDETVRVCPVTPDGIKIRNLGEARVFFGGPGVTADGDTAGWPLEAGESDQFSAPKPKESPVTPAPDGDLDSPVLYARSEQGTCRVAWFSGG